MVLRLKDRPLTHQGPFLPQSLPPFPGSWMDALPIPLTGRASLSRLKQTQPDPRNTFPYPKHKANLELVWLSPLSLKLPPVFPYPRQRPHHLFQPQRCHRSRYKPRELGAAGLRFSWQRAGASGF